MKGHIGAILVSGLSAAALFLAVLQGAVLLAHGPARDGQMAAAATSRGSTRFSAPAGRSAMPFQWTDPAAPQTPALKPDTQQKREERKSPPRSRGLLPEPGPRPLRRAAA